MAEKPLPWFRLYSEAATDQKFDVISMTTGIEWCAVFGAWTKILCVAASSPVRGSLYVTLQKRYSNANVTTMLRFVTEQTDAILNAFIECDMLDIDDQGAYRVKNWDKRQYESDNSTKRVQKLRAEQKENKNKDDVTLHERYENVSVTPPDTDTDTEKKKKRKPAAPPIVFPSSLNTTEFMQAWIEWEIYRIEKKSKLTPSTIKKQLSMLAKYPVVTAILSINTSIEHGWQGLFPDKLNGHHPATSQADAEYVFNPDGTIG